MGYTTEFFGSVLIEPPLNTYEINYLKKFSATRRMLRTLGPYYVDGSGFVGQGHDPDIVDYNRPPEGQPGLWCKWIPTDDGTAIVWDGREKFYDSPEWMQYLIDHFLRPVARAKHYDDTQFEQFTFDHVLNGTIYAEGEDRNDVWDLIVENNTVRVRE